jgi:erfK family protein
MSTYKKILIIILSFIAVIVTFLGIAFFVLDKNYETKFLPETKINNIDVSNLTADEVDDIINNQYVNAYSLIVKNRTKDFQIYGTDVSLKSNYKSEELLKKQTLFDAFKDKNYTIKNNISINNDELIDLLNKKLFQNSAEPKNAEIHKTENGFEITPEDNGSSLDKDITIEKITNAILNGEKEIDLENDYKNAEITKENEKLKSRVNKLNNIAKKKIFLRVYNGDVDEIGFNIFGQFIDENLNVDKEKIKKYVDELKNKYDTANKKRVFTTVSGSNLELSGPYGYTINEKKEIEELTKNVLDENNTERELIYSKKGNFNGTEFGNKYVEVDLENQIVYLVENGEVTYQSKCVSGNLRKGRRTPEGIYSITYKQKNAVLKGQDYASPVKFWMPFNKGIGLHDANWRNKFGGVIYKNNGSHGCINLPIDSAKVFFDNVEAGTPVICYY